MLKIIKSAINTKALNQWSELACNIALDAVRTVEMEEAGRKEIDIKNYAKVEKVLYLVGCVCPDDSSKLCVCVSLLANCVTTIGCVHGF